MGINEIIKIGDRLKSLRISKGLTQAELATKIGIPRTTYANYEANKREPKTDILHKIAQELDVTINDIFTRNFALEQDPDRVYALSFEITKLLPTYSFEEIDLAVNKAKSSFARGEIIITNEEMDKDEKLDFLIGIFSTFEDDKLNELIDILAIKTAYNLPFELYSKYFKGFTNTELIKSLKAKLQADTIEGNEIVWTCILNSLGFEYTLNIMDNTEYYNDTYIFATSLTSKINNIIWEEFSKIPKRFNKDDDSNDNKEE